MSPCWVACTIAMHATASHRKEDVVGDEGGGGVVDESFFDGWFGWGMVPRGSPFRRLSHSVPATRRLECDADGRVNGSLKVGVEVGLGWLRRRVGGAWRSMVVQWRCVVEVFGVGAVFFFFCV